MKKNVLALALLCMALSMSFAQEKWTSELILSGYKPSILSDYIFYRDVEGGQSGGNRETEVNSYFGLQYNLDYRLGGEIRLGAIGGFQKHTSTGFSFVYFGGSIKHFINPEKYQYLSLGLSSLVSLDENIENGTKLEFSFTFPIKTWLNNDALLLKILYDYTYLNLAEDFDYINDPTAFSQNFIYKSYGLGIGYKF